MIDDETERQTLSEQASQAKRKRTTLLTIATFGVVGMDAGAVWYLRTRGYPSDAAGCFDLILASVLPGIIASAAYVVFHVIVGLARRR